MKRILLLIGLALSAFSFVSGQVNKNQLRAKPAEQKEINADKHIEKEIQQKQLSDKPEILEEKSALKESKKASQKNFYKSKKIKGKRMKKADKAD